MKKAALLLVGAFFVGGVTVGAPQPGIAASGAPFCDYWCEESADPPLHYGAESGVEELMLEIHTNGLTGDCGKHRMIFCLDDDDALAIAVAEADSDWLRDALNKPASRLSFDPESDAIYVWSSCKPGEIAALIPLESRIAEALEATLER